MTNIWDMFTNLGLAPVAYFGLFLVGIGVYKFLKDLLPW